MTNNLISKSTVTIKAPVSRVWAALTDPEMIKEYLFGTEVVSDWQVGSSITYKGEWKGHKYEDKGVILEIVPEKLLVSTYWSSMSGEEDTPENYKKVTYELHSDGDQTTLSISNDHNATEEAQKESQGNWDMVLVKLKELLEK
ncbi:MAG: SRPBCC domain-containing protein [Patescibacteria group bacterium]